MASKFNFKKSKNIHTPFPHSTFKERLIKEKAVDLRNNFVIKELEDGYFVVNPLDDKKLIK